MSMLIGAGNAIANFGQTLGNSMMASQERKRRDEQQAFQNLMAQKNFALEQHKMAQDQANIERDRLFKVLGSLPQSTTTVSGDMGRDMLKRGGPEMGLFLKPDETLPTRQFGMTEGGGLAPGAMQEAAPTGDYRVQRPESDAYARAMIQSQDKALDREQRARLAEKRIGTSMAMIKAKLDINKMTDLRTRQIAEAQLAALGSRFAQTMAAKWDANDLDWAEAEKLLEQEWQQMNSNIMMMVPPGM